MNTIDQNSNRWMTVFGISILISFLTTGFTAFATVTGINRCAALLGEVSNKEEKLFSKLIRLHQEEEGIGGLVLRFPELQKHSTDTGNAITTHVLRQMIGELSWADLSLVSARIYVHNSLKRLHETREGIGGLILRFPELKTRGPGLGKPITDSVLRQMIGELSRPELESVIVKISEMSR